MKESKKGVWIVGAAFFFMAVFLLLLLLVSVYLMFSNSYEETISLLLDVFNKPNWIATFKSILTESRYVFTRRMLLIFAGLYAAIGIPILYRHRDQIAIDILSFVSFLKSRIHSSILGLKRLPSIYKVVIFAMTLLFLVKSYYYVFTFPLMYDEAWNYNYFINSNFIIPFVSPHNNHILFTLLAKIFTVLPMEPFIAIRLFLPITAVVTAFILFVFTKKVFDTNIAVIVLALFYSSPWVVTYALYARAYMLTYFFTMLLLWCLYEIVFAKDINKNVFLSFVFSVVLGTYSMPTFILNVGIFVLPVLIFLMFQRRFELLKKTLLYVVLSVIVVLALYSPMILGFGASWLFQAVDQGKEMFNVLYLQKWLWYFSDQSLNVHQLSYWPYVFLIFVTSILCAAVVDYRSKIGIQLIGIISPIVLMLIFQSQMPSRIFSFLCIPIAICLGVFIVLLLPKMKLENTKLIALSAVLIFFFNSYHTNGNELLRWSYDQDKSAKNISQILKDQKVHSVYNFYAYTKPTLEYYASQEQRKLNIIMPDAHSKDYQEFDSLYRYEAIIWSKISPKEKPNFENYQKVFEDVNAQLFLLSK